ncbi:hypothetical protein BH11PSE14_BH11PSE14_00290 [soil metagenome]
MPSHFAVRYLLVATVACVASGPCLAIGACPPQGWSRGELLALPEANFALPNRKSAPGESADILALALLPCLADPDPGLRDGVAFEGLSHWLRGNMLAPATRQSLFDALMPLLGPDGADAAGFRQPFAALVLSEVARSDRKAAWMTPAQRQSLVAATAGYLRGIIDHRGFDPQAGWRHGVAHGSDLVLQLALNPAIDKAQLDALLAALATQVAPTGHAYIDGEPGRMARAVAYIALRDLHDASQWKAWLDGVSSPAPFADWRAASASEAGLERRHDLRAFLLELYAAVRENKEPGLVTLAGSVRAALDATE